MLEKEVDFFRKHADAEILGSDPANKFGEMADFLASFEVGVSGRYVSDTYYEGEGIKSLRGFQSVHGAYGEVSILETLDLHSVSITSCALLSFINWYKELNESYLKYYAENINNRRNKK